MQVVLDVSAFQAVAQLDALLGGRADDEIVGVYIKATQGLGYSDALATAFAQCCIAHNTPFGYYDFLSNDQANAQAARFKDVVARLPRASLIPMVDCEGAYALWSAGVEHWQAAIGGSAITYAQLSNMPRYSDLPTPKWVAQYDAMSYYRPSNSEIALYAAEGYLLWQFTSNYCGQNQDASVLLGDFARLRQP